MSAGWQIVRRAVLTTAVMAALAARVDAGGLLSEGRYKDDFVGWPLIGGWLARDQVSNGSGLLSSVGTIVCSM
ncbi:MAG TPA: hypothetical protein PKC18_01270 [Lacipirellulaceae bacterium]|nr:hypothetical protein [Lacipirellulaceae bacterium]